MSIKVYDKARGTFAWRLWHEPDSDKSGCTKEKDKAIELRLINQPENLNLLYEDELLPLYKLYSVEKTLSEALSRKVWLKCGGYIIIEQTEAMSVVDVNSGKNVTKAKKEADKENNILKTNIEAGIEIIRQLRLRNISGIIIIDFINMAQQESRDKLLSVLKEYARLESIQTNVVDITPLGLVEMTRKNNGKTLKELIKTGE